ncbi:MAG: flagellar biosynthesis anti-sigma factor FlgM [Lachnospiraceae bacterium]|nr:flagellar biosynthesis anti-sigma factor FlgM [Lachnospiraceae bacterium]
MRIEGYSGINQIYKTTNVPRTNKVGKTAYKPDSLEISSFGKDLQTAKQAIAGAPDIRADITEPIKASINAGTYSVDNSDFAGKLIEKYQEKVVF